MAKKKQTLSGAEKTAYGLGSFGFGLIQFLIPLVFFFATYEIHIYGTIIAVACVIAILLSALTEPMLLIASNKLRGKIFGKRFGLLITAVFLLTVIYSMMFCLPMEFPVWVKALYLGGLIIAAELSNCLFSVPYNALFEELPGGSEECKKLLDSRFFFMLVGILVPVGLMGGLLLTGDYRSFGFIGAIIIMLSGICSFLGMYKQIPRLNMMNKDITSPQEQYYHGFLKAYKDREIRTVLIGCTTLFAAICFFSISGLHFFRLTLGFDFGLTTAVFSVFFGALVFFRILFFKSKIPIRAALILSSVILLLGALAIITAFTFLTYGIADRMTTILIIFFAAAFCGIGAGGVFKSRSFFMEKKGKANGLLGICYKIAVACSAIISGIIIDVIGVMSAFTDYTVFGWVFSAAIAVLSIVAIVFFAIKNTKEAKL